MTTTTADGGVRSGGGRRLQVGLVLGITVVAVEALGVVAALPTVADDLDGRALFGAAASAFLLAQVVSIAVCGHLADRRPPARIYGSGLVLMGLGLLAAALAPTMELLVAARVVQGSGAGALSTITFVSVNRAFGEADRPRAMAWLSAAWVAPALVAPAGAGWLADNVSWRWVFGAVLPLIPVVAALALPAMTGLVPRRHHVYGRASLSGQLRAGLGLAAGVAGIQTGLGIELRVVGLPVAVAAAALTWASLRRLVPRATVVASVLGAATLTKLLTGAGFFGADTFLPLAVTEIHGYSATLAGLSLTLASLTWTIGSFVQARRVGVWPDRAMARGGLTLLVVSMVSVFPLLHDLWPVPVTWAFWTVGAIGMGLTYNTANLSAMEATATGREGETGTALAVSDILGAAVSTGIAGALVATGDRSGWSDAASLSGVYGVFLLALVGAFVVAGHLRREPAGPPGSHR